MAAICGPFGSVMKWARARSGVATAGADLGFQPSCGVGAGRTDLAGPGAQAEAGDGDGGFHARIYRHGESPKLVQRDSG
jgi:hypothetical protein